MESNRRDFIKTGAAFAAAIQGSNVLGANDRIRVAVIGLRGRGHDHLKEFHKIDGVEVAAVCDIDENVMAQRLADMEKMGMAKPRTYIDARKLLEDKSIDAVSIATPNHWHSLLGIWACQAGKDAYVEKPCSHNWYEGKQLAAAVKRYNRIVQHGTQSRSSTAAIEAIGHLRNGLIGEVYLSRGLCYKWRDTIGRQPRQAVPAGVHYDLWLGPAPDRGFTLNRFHYNWHWFWDTGNGDIGNQGIHEMDTARWGLGVKWPTKISAIGGHVMFDDDQETPNILNAVFEFNEGGNRKILEFEVRHWITNHEAAIGTWGKSALPPAGLADAKPAPAKPNSPASLGPVSGKPATIGNLYYGPKGYLAIEEYTRYKSFLGDRAEPGPAGEGKETNFQNWVDCLRSRDASKLNAPIEEGYISAALVHLANVSYRLGRTLHFDPQSEQVIGDEEANRLLRDEDRGYRKGFEIPRIEG
ncbi:MAG TPA: Gfo/Idh/MocA family oxidoreductase [Bryobacteraceae bacterium]|jgi:predicted dehydrogenase|nr:Gfo/Idh/MocA family oxidoreductase [Bryobacteraceae bacterium]